ncbi:MAG: aldo/keto reductase [SAR202 cluster bacterium]|nr:aldo/keto reductase [SAR202 cluster bacterium]
MPLPDSAYLQFTDDLSICRVLNGMWQVSGAHGPINPKAALDAMERHHDAGFTTWDLADHYGPAEDFIGQFRRRLAASRGEEVLADIQAFTKWVPPPGPMIRQVVEKAVGVSLRRMGTPRLDLLQFHWWEYDDHRYLDALARLADLASEGKIRHLGLTNFDTEHLEIITAKGISIVSNQVQYSLIDRRPEVRMAAFCRERGVQLLAYGTLCGGLLSERYLGRPEPSRWELDTVSLQKYKQMVDVWGGWTLFQQLLSVLKQVAGKYRVSIANVAVRWVLDRPAVVGAMVGARLGLSDNLSDNSRVFGFGLDGEDRERIEDVISQSKDLYGLIGDCGDEYRR